MVINEGLKVFYFILVSLFFASFCLASEDINLTSFNETITKVPLSSTEKFFWIGVILLVVILFIALYILAYWLSNFNQNKVISSELSEAQRFIIKKSVERAKKLS